MWQWLDRAPLGRNEAQPGFPPPLTQYEASYR